MYQIDFLRRSQSAPGRQACCWRPPPRRALQPLCLHKALRTPSAGPITAPADVVYECLTLLRRPDLESLTPFFPPASFDPRVNRVGLVVGGEVVEEAGPLACCHGFMDTAARRVLPGHLLRRCRVLSSVQLPGGTCALRVALTARTGEEAVFVWRLRRLAGAEAQEQAEAAGREAEDAAGPAHGSTLFGDSTVRDRTRYDASPQAHRRTESHPDPQAGAGTGWEPSSPQDPAGSSCSSSSSNSSSSNSSSSNSGGRCISNAGDGDGGGSDGDGWGGSAAGPGRLGATAAARPSGSWGTSSPAGPSQPAPPPPPPPPPPFLSASSVSSAASPSSTAAGVQHHPGGGVTAWVVESISRDGSNDEEEMPAPGPAGRGPHPRCSPEQVVKAQLAALRRGDVAGAASYNVWSRSTSGGWDLHLSAFRAMLRQPSYHALLTSYDEELGPSALPSMRRMLQEVRLTQPGVLYGNGGGGATAGGGSSFVYQLCMGSSGCWLVEGIRAVR